MRKKVLLLLFSIFLLALPQARAAHLVGGEITYRCTGNNNYEIILRIYRDCLSTGAPFDPKAVITVYRNSNNWVVSNDSVSLLSITQLPVVAPNNCTTLPQTVCTETGIYKYTVQLPPVQGGYTISHQRCCRNNTITNVNNTTSQWGSTYTTTIPSNDNSCNSSPAFAGDPPVVLCLNVDVELDLSANDPDADSLHYELCDILHGGSNSTGSVAPSPAAPPPYLPVPFITGYTVTNPITSAPAFNIDPNTGILKGIPTQVGQFVFAICVQEFRNGNLLSTVRRDFQFNVSNACQAIVARIQDQRLTPQNYCTGGPIQFRNTSISATTYFWDFGDTAVVSDTSRLPNPRYFYADTGSYKVMLVADPHTSCADTTYGIFEVYDSTEVKFTHSGEKCFNANLIDFETSGRYTSNASFQWDFGGNTNVGSTSSDESPKNISWAQPGSYYVSVLVTDFKCSDVYGDTVHIFERPEIGEDVPAGSGCLPHTVQFTDKTKAMGPVEHWWFFGDGGISKIPNPTYTYTSPGTYTVHHMIRSTKGCVDSGYSVYPEVINVYPVPMGGLNWDSQEVLIYDPTFTVRNTSEAYSSSLTILPDGQELLDMKEATFTMEDTGNFEVYHYSYNQFGCVDTVIDTIRVNDPFTLYIPNAFTPDGDGINDLFTFKMSGISEIHLEIYNRWGELVYQSNDPYAGWDGTDRSGRVSPAGVYSFVLVCRAREGATDHVETGTITLLR